MIDLKPGKFAANKVRLRLTFVLANLLAFLFEQDDFNRLLMLAKVLS